MGLFSNVSRAASHAANQVGDAFDAGADGVAEAVDFGQAVLQNAYYQYELDFIDPVRAEIDGSVEGYLRAAALAGMFSGMHSPGFTIANEAGLEAIDRGYIKPITISDKTADMLWDIPKEICTAPWRGAEALGHGLEKLGQLTENNIFDPVTKAAKYASGLVGQVYDRAESAWFDTAAALDKPTGDLGELLLAATLGGVAGPLVGGMLVAGAASNVIAERS